MNTKPRPTEADFDELKRKRDESILAVAAKMAEELGVAPEDLVIHSHGRGNGICYCACPSGPCQHEWDGPQWVSEDECSASVTCSRCGEIAMYHDMRCAP